MMIRQRTKINWRRKTKYCVQSIEFNQTTRVKRSSKAKWKFSGSSWAVFSLSHGDLVCVCVSTWGVVVGCTNDHFYEGGGSFGFLDDPSNNFADISGCYTRSYINVWRRRKVKIKAQIVNKQMCKSNAAGKDRRRLG